MDEYLKQILSYLPVQFFDDEANEFVKYLGDAYIDNLEKEKYQFAFIAFHMLNMVFIYKVKWFLKKQGNSNILTLLQNHLQNNKGTSFNTLFDLSLFPEKNSLEAVLKSLSFHANDIEICKNHVVVRNHCSHASGRIYYKTQAKINYYIEEEIEFIKKIQKKLETELKKFLQTFLEENWQKNFIIGDIKNLFKENYFSIADLELLSIIDLPLFRKKSNTEKSIKQKIIYLLFIFEIQNQLESENNLFLEKLPIFMIGIPKKIKVEKEDGEIEIYIDELIEESLIPLISNFQNNDRKKCERILKIRK